MKRPYSFGGNGNVLKKQAASGQALPEYGLLLALVTIFCIAALVTLGETISEMMIELADFMTSTVSG